MFTVNSFTLEQIKARHTKVKSGADFPTFIEEILQLGVTTYETYVADGHTLYFGKGGYQIGSGAKYDALSIAETSHKLRFEQDLKEHQQGNTDYATFCRQAARWGVEKWVVDIEKMTCTYYDKRGNQMLVEAIP